MRDRCFCAVIGMLFLGGILSNESVAVAASDVVMTAGAAKIKITPDLENLKDLTTVMGTKAKQIDHDIYARALVLNDGTSRLAIVTYDLN